MKRLKSLFSKMMPDHKVQTEHAEDGGGGGGGAGAEGSNNGAAKSPEANPDNCAGNNGKEQQKISEPVEINIVEPESGGGLGPLPQYGWGRGAGSGGWEMGPPPALQQGQGWGGGRGHGYGIDIGSGNCAVDGNDIRIRNVLAHLSQGMHIGSNNVSDTDNLIRINLSPQTATRDSGDAT